MAFAKIECTNCKYYLREVDQQDLLKNTGACRRYPPAVNALPYPSQNMAGQMQMGAINVVAWPAVEGKQWCGEFSTGRAETEAPKGDILVK
jgi:hypothetical protein